jgi:hypothetical protein
MQANQSRCHMEVKGEQYAPNINPTGQRNASWRANLVSGKYAFEYASGIHCERSAALGAHSPAQPLKKCPDRIQRQISGVRMHPGRNMSVEKRVRVLVQNYTQSCLRLLPSCARENPDPVVYSAFSQDIILHQEGLCVNNTRQFYI